MLKYLIFFLLPLFGSCSTDPLVLNVVKSEAVADEDGLKALVTNEKSAAWEEGEDGVLTANAPASLTLFPQGGAFTLSVLLLADQTTRATLQLGGGIAIELPSLDLNQDAGGRRGEASIQPGIWQQLELSFQPGSAGEPALLVACYLNGNLVYYQQSLAVSGSGSGPVSLELSEGSLSIDDLRYTDRAGEGSTITDDGKIVLNLPLIRYTYFESEDRPIDPADFSTMTPKKEGFISRFDLWSVRDRRSEYGIRFTADLQVPRAGDYTFGSSTRAGARIYLDDEMILDVDGDSSEEDGETVVTLTEGEHRIRVDYYQLTNAANFNLYYIAPGGERTALNDLSGSRDIITPPSTDITEIELDDRPYLLRSFLNFPPGKVYDYTDKRTHVVNVGEREGPNYSYDLQSGSILQVWRGKFVDVSNMWVERGQAQIARPLGQLVAFDGKIGWSETQDDWVDSLSDVRHLRYDLDAAGRPTFVFGTDDEETLLTDRIVPSENGLERTLTNEAGEMVQYVLLGSARKITERSLGSFSLRGPGINLDVRELASGSLTLLRGDNVERLVAELPPGEHITYSINW